MPFLRNCWYMAGWSHEVQAKRLLGRRVAGEAMMLFRDPAGVVHATGDRCPHRFAPLHLGHHLGDRVQCAYHGLQFDGSGRCVHNPHGSGAIAPHAKVASYPLVERWGCLWVWPGEAAAADPSTIPDFSCLDEEVNHVGHGYMLANADYRLETDNIMDLSHIEFLHPGTLGGGGVSSGKTEVNQDGTTVWSRRMIRSQTVPDFIYRTFGIEHGTPLDRRVDVRWDPPASMLIFASFKPSVAPDDAFRGRRIANIFTPETETTTHYWYAISYDARALPPENGKAIAQKATDDLRQPFEKEDLPMLEAVQASMEGADFWSLRPLILESDVGAVRARRTLDKLICEEQGVKAVA
jgi:vanillate O-demethylase monooxygenase subunit